MNFALGRNLVVFAGPSHNLQPCVQSIETSQVGLHTHDIEGGNAAEGTQI